MRNTDADRDRLPLDLSDLAGRLRGEADLTEQIGGDGWEQESRTLRAAAARIEGPVLVRDERSLAVLAYCGDLLNAVGLILGDKGQSSAKRLYRARKALEGTQDSLDRMQRAIESDSEGT